MAKRNETYIFSFETITTGNNYISDKISRLCYCYGDTVGNIYKSGAMNLLKSPFLINNFLELLDKIKSKHELHIVSNMDSIIFLAMCLAEKNLKLPENIIDINSYISSWKLFNYCENNLNSYTFKEIYKVFVRIKYHYPKLEIFDKNNNLKQNNMFFLKGITYALEYPLEAIKISSKNPTDQLDLKTDPHFNNY